MFGSAIKKAHNVVEGLALEAAFGFAAVLLACGSLFFAAAGAALWLSTAMPAHLALLVVSFFTALIASAVFYLGRHEAAIQEEADPEAIPESPLSTLMKSMGSMAGPVDLVASGLFARQLKRAPVSTLAASAAVGAVLGLLANTSDDD